MNLEDIKAWARTMRAREIKDERGNDYLTRYDVRGWLPGDLTRFPVNVYLHHIHQPDADPLLHSHPWEWAETHVLSGGYLQEVGHLVQEHMVSVKPRWLHEGSTYSMDGTFFHRITRVLDDTWTLFMTGPKRSSWGFYDAARGVIPWRDRLRERGIEPQY